MSESPASGPVSRLRAELEVRDVRQVHIAKLLGKSQQAVSRRMSGETAITVDEFLALCKAYGIDTQDVLEPAHRSSTVERPKKRHRRLWKPSSMTKQPTGTLGFAG